MQISNENWSWGQATKRAWELSKCNPGITFYVECNRFTERWYIMDWKPESDDSRWNQFESGTSLLNGKRV